MVMFSANASFSASISVTLLTFDSIFAKAAYSDWIIKCKVKQEMFGDESRVKATVFSMAKLD